MLQIACCTECGTPAYPSRRLCPVCGSGAWRVADASLGAIDDVTVLRHRAGADDQAVVYLATVVTSAGPTVVASLDAALARGTPVELALGADGRLSARAAGASGS